MAFSDLGILGLLKTKMKWHQARQKVLAENVANADTPNYRAKDLKQPDFRQSLELARANPISTTATHRVHYAEQASAEAKQPFQGASSKGWEVTPAGNAVVLEEEMIKVSENQFDYQLASTIYARSLGLLRTALGRNG